MVGSSFMEKRKLQQMNWMNWRGIEPKALKIFDNVLFYDLFCNFIILYSILVFLPNIFHGLVYAEHSSNQCDLLYFGNTLA